MDVNSLHKVCPICGGHELKEIVGYENDKLHRCSVCKGVFSRTIPSDDELLKHYSFYNRGRYISPLTLKRYEELLNQFQPYNRLNRLLDVGCGSGYFLDTAKKMGWDVHGTEYGQEAIDFCANKGLNVCEGDLLNQDFPSNSFDVITSFEVIEHLSFPVEHMAKIFDLLRPGGLFYVTTPNFNALSRRFLKDTWTVISYPEHLTYFTPRTLHFALNKIGFEKGKLSTTGISVDAIRNSLSKTRVVSENKKPEEQSVRLTNESLRKAAQSNPIVKFAKNSVDFGLNASGMGDFLKATYLKPLK